MKSKLPKLALLALMLPMATGCASLFAGGSPALHVDVDNANVPDITVTITGLQDGDRWVEHATEFQVNLQRTSDYLIEVQAPGYETQQIEVGRTVNPVTFVNILFWPGFLIDLADGAFWQPDREVVQVHLARRLGSSGAVELCLRLDAPGEGWHKVVELQPTARR